MELLSAALAGLAAPLGKDNYNKAAEEAAPLILGQMVKTSNADALGQLVAALEKAIETPSVLVTYLPPTAKIGDLSPDATVLVNLTGRDRPERVEARRGVERRRAMAR